MRVEKLNNESSKNHPNSARVQRACFGEGGKAQRWRVSIQAGVTGSENTSFHVALLS